MMRAHPQNGHVIVQDLYQAAVLAQFQHFRTERCLDGRIGNGERTGCSRSRQPGMGLQGKLHVRRDGRQLVECIECQGIQFLGGVEE